MFNLFKKKKSKQLSEMEMEHSFDFLLTLAMNVEPLFNNEDLKALRNSFKPLEDETVAETFHRIAIELIKNVKFIAGDYRENIYEILKVKNQITLEEAKKYKLGDALQEFAELFSDEQVMAFLKQSTQSE